MGFLEPEGGIIRLSGTSTVEVQILEELKVRVGDRVEAEQVLAVFDSYDRHQVALEKADTNVAISKARLEQLMAGARQGRVAAQQAVLDTLIGQSKWAAADCARAKHLFEKNTVTSTSVDTACRKQAIFTSQAAEAKAKLTDIIEIRDVDVAVLQAQLHDAQAARKQAAVEAETSFVRAPVAGQVLRIHTRPGEAVGRDGILELGQTARMWVRAEIYETDIARIAIDQQAVVTSDGFPDKLLGKVAEIGLTVGGNKIRETDPTADVDARVVEVKIQLDAKSSLIVDRMTNMQVNVIIDVGAGS